MPREVISKKSPQKILRIVIYYRGAPCADTIFPGNCRHFSSQRRVHSVVNLGARSENTTAQ